MPGSSRLVVLWACCLLQGAAVRLARQAPEVAEVLHLSREAEKVVDGAPLRKLGSFAVSSNSIAARLPSSKASKAWGDDKLKTLSVVGAKDGDFSAGIFGTAGTDATKLHALYGGGYKGLQSNGGLPSQFGVLGVAKADPGNLEVVHAIPSANGGVDYGQLKLAVTRGHLSPDQLWGRHQAASESTQESAEAEAARAAAAHKAYQEEREREAAEAAAAIEGRKKLEREMAQARENQRVWAEEAARRESAEAEQAAKRKEAEEAAEAERRRAAEEAAAQAAKVDEQRRREAAEKAERDAKELVKRAAEEEERRRAAEQKAEEEKAAKAAEEAARKLAQKAEEDAREAAQAQAAAAAAQAAAAAAQATTSSFPPAADPPSKDWLKSVGEAMKDWNKTPASQQAVPAVTPGGDFLKKVADALSKKPTPEQLEKRKEFLKSLGIGEVKPPTAEQIEQGKEFFKKLAEKKAKTSKKTWSVFPSAKGNSKPGEDWLKKIQEAVAAAKPAGKA